MRTERQKNWNDPDFVRDKETHRQAEKKLWAIRRALSDAQDVLTRALEAEAQRVISVAVPDEVLDVGEILNPSATAKVISAQAGIAILQQAENLQEAAVFSAHRSIKLGPPEIFVTIAEKMDMPWEKAEADFNPYA